MFPEEVDDEDADDRDVRNRVFFIISLNTFFESIIKTTHNLSIIIAKVSLVKVGLWIEE